MAGWPVQEPRRAARGMIASLNPLASAAGLRVLQKGGNAVDAAIAAGAVLTVVEPWTGQLGGDAFMLIANGADQSISAVNGSGAAPAAAEPGRYRRLGSIPETGWLAATVPGIVDAWHVALERYGTMPLAMLLEDAVEYAEHGFPVTARQARQNQEMVAVAMAFPETQEIFSPQGRAPAAGQLLRQQNLAATLRALQVDGPDGFYRGSIARAIVDASDRGGGLFTLADFAEHRTEVLDPIRTTYRGWTVVEQPPVSQGVILLMALNLLETAELPTTAATRIHRQVEAHKLALQERLQFVGDPRTAQLDLDRLLDKSHAIELAKRIEPARARPLGTVPAGHPDTTYLCVVDEARNVVSYIHSLYAGNGVVAGPTGVLLNNRMGCFSLEEGSPNLLQGGKRPIHTLNSWLLLRDGRPRLVGGTPGSFWQVQTNLQLINHLVDDGLPAQPAVDAPRWRMGSQTSWTDSSLELEGRFGEAAAAELRRLGHQVSLLGDWEAGGSAQVIAIESEALVGATDPRPGTGAVLGY
ncbi:MAG TPA: gamma-glutamyltransferase [Candidatus Dormibacteraeota bacterium]|nr:gamma-glutamyltransferase [Candidatus Dormibacteraeota bacterium]